MEYLIFSDLHGDKEGLALLRDHPKFQDKKIICLGDIVEFNDEATDFYRQVEQLADTIILGNHEAVLIDKCPIDIFNPKVQTAIKDTKKRLEASNSELLTDWVKLPIRGKAGNADLTHGSFNSQAPWAHVRYVEDLVQESMHVPGQTNILAHGHIPFIAWKQDGLWFYNRQIYGRTFKLHSDITYIINSGSVLGSREMRWHEKTFLTYDDEAQTVQFFNLGDQ